MNGWEIACRDAAIFSAYEFSGTALRLRRRLTLGSLLACKRNSWSLTRLRRHFHQVFDRKAAHLPADDLAYLRLWHIKKRRRLRLR